MTTHDRFEARLAFSREDGTGTFTSSHSIA